MKRKFRLSLNAPVTVGFALAALIALILGYITDDASTVRVFSVYRASLKSPLTWLRFFTHVLGHADIEHYVSNITLMLVVGPGIEERLGGRYLLGAMALTAFITGLAQYILFPSYMLLGASGIVFMMLVLASSSSATKDGGIPITLVLVFIFYIGGEIIDGILFNDNVSQLTHILGGGVGAYFGLKAGKMH